MFLCLPRGYSRGWRRFYFWVICRCHACESDISAAPRGESLQNLAQTVYQESGKKRCDFFRWSQVTATMLNSFLTDSWSEMAKGARSACSETEDNTAVSFNVRSDVLCSRFKDMKVPEISLRERIMTVCFSQLECHLVCFRWNVLEKKMKSLLEFPLPVLLG